MINEETNLDNSIDENEQASVEQLATGENIENKYIGVGLVGAVQDNASFHIKGIGRIRSARSTDGGNNNRILPVMQFADENGVIRDEIRVSNSYNVVHGFNAGTITGATQLGERNVFIGDNTGISTVQGNYNVHIGSNIQNSNNDIPINEHCGNVLLGAYSRALGELGIKNAIAIGTKATTTKSNQCQIGNNDLSEVTTKAKYIGKSFISQSTIATATTTPTLDLSTANQSTEIVGATNNYNLNINAGSLFVLGSYLSGRFLVIISTGSVSDIDVSINQGIGLNSFTGISAKINSAKPLTVEIIIDAKGTVAGYTSLLTNSTSSTPVPYSEPIGTIKIWGSEVVPSDDWQPCDGRSIVPTTPNVDFNALYQVLGNRFGGNGVTSLALPDLRSRTPVGSGTELNNGGVNYFGDVGTSEIGQGYQPVLANTLSTVMNADNLPEHKHIYTDYPILQNTDIAVGQGTTTITANQGSGRRVVNDNGMGLQDRTGGNINQYDSRPPSSLNISTVQPYLCMNFIIKVK